MTLTTGEPITLGYLGAPAHRRPVRIGPDQPARIVVAGGPGCGKTSWARRIVHTRLVGGSSDGDGLDGQVAVWTRQPGQWGDVPGIHLVTALSALEHDRYELLVVDDADLLDLGDVRAAVTVSGTREHLRVARCSQRISRLSAVIPTLEQDVHHRGVTT